MYLKRRLVCTFAIFRIWRYFAIEGRVKPINWAIAWKDAGQQVWIVDMKTAPEFKIIKRFKDAGADIHDASVSDGGRYYMLADHKGNQLWILDTYKAIGNDSTFSERLFFI